ncbi:MAG TPA: hypothetical protein VGC76_18600 [Pyrinomonadaceae bacterium]
MKDPSVDYNNELFTGNADLQLTTGLVPHLRFGKNTPLPDCAISFYEGETKPEYSGPPDMEYHQNYEKNPHTGETDDGKDCRGVINKGEPPANISISIASVVVSQSGNFNVEIKYSPVGDAKTERWFIMSSGQKGWF